MKKILLGLMLLISSTCFGAGSQVLVDDNGKAIGTSTNPVHVSPAGGGGFSQWITSTNVGIGTTDNVGIGTINPTDTLLVSSPSGGATLDAAITGIGGIDSFTKTMLHLDNNVTDSENTPKTFTNNNVTFQTSPVKFGTHSALFNGSTAYLTTPHTADFDFPADFTLEAWVYPTTIDGATHVIMGTADANAGTGGCSLFESGNSPNNIAVYCGGAGINISGPSGMVVNNLYHVEGDRCSGAISVYVNGISVASGSNGGATSSSNAFNVGTNTGTLGFYYFPGNIDELRVTKGSCRHSSNFIPPAAPYTPAAKSESLTFSVGGVTTSQITSSNVTNTLKLINNNVTGITIDSAGNVGIGTTAPPTALYVVGTGYFTSGLNIGIGTASPTRLCVANNAVTTCP